MNQYSTSIIQPIIEKEKCHEIYFVHTGVNNVVAVIEIVFITESQLKIVKSDTFFLPLFNQHYFFICYVI